MLIYMTMPNIKRNKELVALRLFFPEEWSFRKLGRHFDMKESTTHEIFYRDKDKFYKNELKEVLEELGVIHS